MSFAAQESARNRAQHRRQRHRQLLGRNITATIAICASLQWERSHPNLSWYFSPTHSPATASWLATLTRQAGDARRSNRHPPLGHAKFPAFDERCGSRCSRRRQTTSSSWRCSIRAAGRRSLGRFLVCVAAARLRGNRAPFMTPSSEDAGRHKAHADRRLLTRILCVDRARHGHFRARGPVGAAAWFVVSRIMGSGCVTSPRCAFDPGRRALVLTVGIGLDRHVACAGPQASRCCGIL